LKVKLGPRPLVYPIPIVIGGANVHGKPNWVLLGDTGLMGVNPPLIYISLHRDHYTTIGVLENRTFSVNIPHTGMLADADYCGTVSGAKVDKSGLFQAFYGDTGTAPMAEECPVNLECRVVHDFSIQHRHIFVGEVVQAYAGEQYVEERDGKKGLIDMTRLDPILYSLDNQYYSAGKRIGEGYREAGKRKSTA
jgi:flavin reductase (DIM6/NTAB) family NADH-FMN oxidoreductase RutF